MEVLAITAGMLMSRGISKGLQRISDLLFPYEKSREAKRVEHAAKLNLELEMYRQQSRLKELGIQAKINQEQQMTIRETNLLLAQLNSRNHIKEELFRDSIRRFPLNLSPLSLLENNDIDIDFFVQGFKSKSLSSEEQKTLLGYLHNNVKPLNIFVLPITIDSRVGGKENIAAQVWDSVYERIESIFINEFNVISEHPVNLYSTAWNQNARPGLHAAEELYFFLKYLPCVVAEPRFDGKKLRIVFSCWSIGYNLGQKIRQEIVVDFDWLPIIVTNAYERSKESLKLLSGISVTNDSLLKKKKDFCEHNIKTFEDLKIEQRVRDGKLDDLDVLGDYSRWFALDPYDWGVISDKISHSLGLIMAAISDTHHLLTSDVEPVLPKIYKKYFDDILDKDMAQMLLDMYESAYQRLILLEPYNQQMKDLREMQIRNIYKEFPMLPAPKGKSLQALLIERCGSRWGYMPSDEDDAFNYYVNHFTQEDMQFNNELKPYLSHSRVKEIQRRCVELRRK